ncbi:MotA/TolQ/ExbB proton channel family protein [uncultured Helicobacter sp.]|uniref:MotA/TolQ/ExbB proton channel family protein n=1 Tax=uncultured Helicobacter sp. TaxID=175537 RepID=UPI0026171FF7|nr:MotA/TolQ/ExbB proton channel family protein [uncultured Helicobacter sp.]
MNLTTLLSDYGVTAIVVLVWLSLYFILVVWTFVYRYLVLNIALNNEKKCLEVLLSGRNALPKNSLLGSNLIGIDKKLTEPMLQYSLDKAIKDATIGLTFLGIVASTAPFIGLFGTVVEILEAFSKLGTNSKATLDVIAPVISKALVATAAGILTAVPAYSFNYLQLQINVLISPKTNL